MIWRPIKSSLFLIKTCGRFSTIITNNNNNYFFTNYIWTQYIILNLRSIVSKATSTKRINKPYVLEERNLAFFLQSKLKTCAKK